MTETKYSYPKNNSPWLKRAFELAKRGQSRVAKNPQVGAVLVYEDRVIGEGWHAYYGGPHAEVNAVRCVRPEDHDKISESTLFVTLEPCNFHGKTPACSQLVLDQKIPHVVVGTVDPNPRVAGKSLAHLAKQGVKIELAEDSGPFLELIHRFRVNQSEKRAYAVLKWAETRDGFIAGLNEQGEPRRTQITGPESSRLVHRLRSELQAILIGSKTALVDNPSLTTRNMPGPNPVKLLLDADLEVPDSHQLFRLRSPLIIFNRKKSGVEGQVKYVDLRELDGGMKGLLTYCYEVLEIGSVLVEGGANVLQQFLAEGCFDEIYRSIGPAGTQTGVMAPRLAKIAPEISRKMNQYSLGKDLVFHWRRELSAFEQALNPA